MERAVIRGIIKAYIIIVLFQAAAEFLIWIIYMMITNYINP